MHPSKNPYWAVICTLIARFMQIFICVGLKLTPGDKSMRELGVPLPQIFLGLKMVSLIQSVMTKKYVN